MSRHGCTKLVPPKPELEKQSLETLERSLLGQTEQPAITELDNEIEYPRCNDLMELVRASMH
jgi:hypothetical protein